MISVGDSLPDAKLIRMTDSGPEVVRLSDKLTGRKVVLVAVPAAFSGLCDQVHLPSFIRTKPQFDAKGVDEIICLAVNDPFVMKAWGESTGATEAGITLLADADGSFTREIGMNFDAPVVGLYGRSVRYAMVVEDGVVRALNTESEHGICDRTAGETLLEEI
ncbi:thiol peroxidase [Ruegeria marisrubri]|uniref:Glutathione-dependent peroxiredoxin n=1 Tax=Ruegeria marisrubri TaxID=1685379 RepID=A0A0X3TL58_9RHOB|nr:peroxiredoxin [Ruegeria marisrubri]KUJ76512.1 thiol peroxidase [Ruegeria marisrubri]